MRLLIAVVVWIGAVAGAAGVSSVVADSIHNGSVGSADVSLIKGADASSLFRTVNFTRALSAARSSLGDDAKIDNFVIYPGYLSVTAVTATGELDFYVNANGRVDKTATSGSPGSSPLLTLNEIAPTDPATLAHRITTAAHLPESQLHYMVAEADSSTGKFRWLIYPVQGTTVEYFQAAGARGRLLEYRTNSSTGLQPVS